MTVASTMHPAVDRHSLLATARGTAALLRDVLAIVGADAALNLILRKHTACCATRE
ncbi:hypothetical protein ACQEU6_01580 [Spirillospora sp. CA-108201]